MNPFLRRPKTVALWGALMLWVAFPVVFGAFLLVANALVQHHNSSALAVAGMVLWAIVCFVLLLVGFIWMMIGLFLWWREHNNRPLVRHTVSDETKQVLADAVRSRGSSRAEQPVREQAAGPEQH